MQNYRMFFSMAIFLGVVVQGTALARLSCSDVGQKRLSYTAGRDVPPQGLNRLPFEKLTLDGTVLIDRGSRDSFGPLILTPPGSKATPPHDDIELATFALEGPQRPLAQSLTTDKQFALSVYLARAVVRTVGAPLGAAPLFDGFVLCESSGYAGHQSNIPVP